MERKRIKRYLWQIFATLFACLTVVFGALTVSAAVGKSAKGEFPVDVSRYKVSEVCETENDYVLGTEDGTILYFQAGSSEPLWTYVRHNENGDPSVTDIAAHGGKIYAAFSDRRICVFDKNSAGEIAPQKTYRLGLAPVSLYFGEETNLFVAYGETGNDKGLYFFHTDDESENQDEISYFSCLSKRNNLLGNGFLNALVADGQTVYFTDETSEIVKVNVSETLSADDLTVAYTGENNFVALTTISDGIAAMDRFMNVFRFDGDMKLTGKVDGTGITVTAAFSGGNMFIAKIKNGGIVGVDPYKGQVFSVSSEYSSIILFASDEGFVYLTEDGGDFVYMDLAAALKKEWAEKTFSVWLALFLIFLLAAAYTLLCCKRSLRQSINGGLKKVGKIAVKHRIAYLSLIPTFLLLAVFYWYPIASSLVLSFFDYLPKEKMIFVGMDNILKVARNTEFWLSFKNTLIFLVADLIKAILPPILFAECLLALRSQKISYWVRVFMFLPGVIPGVAGMLVWADGIYGSTSSGLLNGFLSAISPSFVSRAWLMDKSTALTCLIFIGFPWVGSYLIFFGAISGLPKEMFEAAKLDGCGWWRKLVSFDIPLIVPQIKYIFITTFIGSVQNYTLIYVTTGGDYGTNTPALMMYYAITDQKNYGIASAMGLFLFIFLVGATAVNFKMQFGRTKEDY